MSIENIKRITKLHEMVKEPLRREILLQLRQRKNMNLNAIAKRLNIQDVQELSVQLNILEKMTIENERIIIKQTDGTYCLTEKGHYALDKMITFPQLRSDDYQLLYSNISKPRLKLAPSFWTLLVVATIVICAILSIIQKLPLENAVLILVLALVTERIALYVQFQPARGLNRVAYILRGISKAFIIWILLVVIAASFFGVWMKDIYVFIFGNLAALVASGALIRDFMVKSKKDKS
jgi:hypothetical protein